MPGSNASQKKKFKINAARHKCKKSPEAPLNMLLAIWFMLFLSVPLVWGQFPAICNTPDSLDASECCPNDCSGRGECVNITNDVVVSWNRANKSVVEILRNGPNNES